MRVATLVRLFALAAIGLALTAPALGQGHLCKYAPAIVSLANSAIAKRGELTGFERRRAPMPAAAYLTIRYTPLSDTETEALLSALIADDARGVDEVAFAWSYGMDGDVTERLLGPDAVTGMITTGNLSAIRAMIREGDEDELLAAYAAMEGPNLPMGFLNVALALLDYPDEAKQQIVQKAMNRDMPHLAAVLVATDRKGPKAWSEFEKRLSDPALIDLARGLWSWAPFYVGNPALPRPADADPVANPAMRERINEVAAWSILVPQINFLNTLLNQSGEVDKVHAAAEALRAAVESGEIERDGRFGPAWVLMYRALASVWGDVAALDGMLTSFEVSPGRDSDKPLVFIKHVIALEALTPFIRDESTAIPDVPAELSADIETWAHWLAIAAKVRADPTDPSLVEDTALPIAADMLVAMGQAEAAARLIAAAPANASVVRLAVDLAAGLDRDCESYLYHPAESLHLLPIYKFDN